MGKEWDKFKDTGSSKYFHSPDKETEKGFGARDFGTPIKSLPRFAIDMKIYQEWCYDWAVEVFRVLKPGAHFLSFSGTRTYHRLACAIEDAGFEIRDMVEWFYGSGFPKGQNISKAIDKRVGALREVIGEGRSGKGRTIYEGTLRTDWKQEYDITMPSTEEAKQWQGWNTQLKPAHEPIVFARKPISEKSIVDNVLIHGTAAINVDACRIAVSPDVDAAGKTTKRGTREAETWREGSGFKNPENAIAGVLPSGRYPANLILSHHPDCKMIQEGVTKVKDVSTHAQSQKMGKHGIYGDYQVPVNLRHDFQQTSPEVWECVEGCPVRILNEQSGDTKYAIVDKLDSVDSKTPILGSKGIYGLFEAPRIVQRYGGSGGAARFFYCAKPSVAERNAGIKDKRNVHITVKPLEIMRWLVRLVTQKGGVVLDPFLGSGTTAIAAENEGFEWLGCDNNEEYCEIAEARIKALGGERIGRKHDFSGWQKRKKIRESSKSAKGVF